MLDLYKSWNDLAPQRKAFSAFFNETQAELLSKCGTLQPEHQIDHMRQSFQEKLSALRQSKDSTFEELTNLVTFFELIGLYVKNGYLPLRDISQAYKGPILKIDVVWRDFIRAWEKEAHVAPGLLEHAIFLMNMVRTKEDRPIYYWVVYRFRRFF